MTNLALPTLDNQLSAVELELAQLNSAIAQKKALRKAIADKKKQAQKVFTQLETALMQVEQVFSELGESAKELKAIALEKISEYFPKEGVERGLQQNNQLIKSQNLNQKSLLPRHEAAEGDFSGLSVESPTDKGNSANLGKRAYELEPKLVEFPKKKNDSNEFFTWQPTSNRHVASYFNVTKGVAQTTYIGANNKQNLKSVGANLQNLFEISFEIRKATRLTEFKYEIKIKGLDDNAIGWLAQFDYSQKFYPQFACILQKPEISTELIITENNWIAAPGAAIVNNLFPYTCHIVEVDKFGTGIVKDQSGKKFEIHLDDWHLAEDFQREAEFTYSAIKACKTKKELEIIKNSNQVEADFLKFVWHNMPKEDRETIKEMCDKEPLLVC